jgi:hypothetical protein
MSVPEEKLWKKAGSQRRTEIVGVFGNALANVGCIFAHLKPEKRVFHPCGTFAAGCRQRLLKLVVI